MVGPRTIMKLIHCRGIKLKCSNSFAKDVSKRKIKENGVGTSPGTLDYAVNVKVEPANDLCRICLQEAKIPIFGNNVYENIAESVNTFGGIEVSINDLYPKNICKACHALLEGALLFRKIAQQSEELLKQSNACKAIKDEHFIGIGAIKDNKTANDVEQSVEYSRLNDTIKKPGESDTEIDDYSSDFPSSYEKECSKNLIKREVGVARNKISSNERTGYDCKKCSLKFNSFQEYSDHRLTDEHENKKNSCPICNNLYPPHYLKKHIAHHNREASFVCDVCGRNFVLQSSFRRHRLTHFYSLPVKCPLCPYRGRFPESLRMHMRSHTGERPYTCTECPAKFVSKSNLSKHINTHKKQYDFNCEVCGRGFHIKRELEQHIKVVHMGIMDYSCRICNKAFGYRKHMMRHELKVHKREKLRSGKMPLYLQIENMKDKHIET